MAGNSSGCSINIMSDNTLVQEPNPTSTSSVLKSGLQMKALVYHGAGKKAWEEKPKPTILKVYRCNCKNYKDDDLRN